MWGFAFQDGNETAPWRILWGGSGAGKGSFTEKGTGTIRAPTRRWAYFPPGRKNEDRGREVQRPYPRWPFSRTGGTSSKVKGGIARNGTQVLFILNKGGTRLDRTAQLKPMMYLRGHFSRPLFDLATNPKRWWSAFRRPCGKITSSNYNPKVFKGQAGGEFEHVHEWGDDMGGQERGPWSGRGLCGGRLFPGCLSASTADICPNSFGP